MKCVNCENEQASGKFCGKCGTPLQAVETTKVEVDSIPAQESVETAATVESVTSSQPTPEPAPHTAPTQPNEQVERVKETSKKYVAYVKEYVVNPGKIFEHPEHQFTNALISIALVLLLASYAIFSTINELYNKFMKANGYLNIFEVTTSKLSLFPTISNAFIALLVLMAISFGVMLAILKIAKQPTNFKQLISIYGTLLVPVAGIMLVALVLILIKVLSLGFGILVLGYLMALYLYPLYIVFHNFGGDRKVDVLNRGLIYFSGFSIISYIIISQYVKSKVGSFMELFYQVGNYF